MTLFVDTSVWSLALRRDQPSPSPQVRALLDALEGDVRQHALDMIPKLRPVGEVQRPDLEASAGLA